ncbi:DUF3592 domain-containing protein [Streptomyces sp. NPDC048282]|uniref:DUF3592 domain-containing protein n=1 Tax=Streptomyces sp. NPDC048282 TaxID=3365528 RepID=UPI0037183257
MDERDSSLNDRQDGRLASPAGWEVPAVVVIIAAIVVWWAFGPIGPLPLYVLGCAVVLAAANRVSRVLVRRWSRTHGGAGRVAALVRIRPESWLLAPRWTTARITAAGFLVFAIVSGITAWKAGQEYQLLSDLRHHGRRTDATVVKISDRSEENWVNAVTARYDTGSGAVEAYVDVPAGSATDPAPGSLIPVVFDPSHPTEVRHVAYLDGRDADGIRDGSIVTGLLAAGFLVGTVTVVVRTKRQTRAVEPDC